MLLFEICSKELTSYSVDTYSAMFIAHLFIIACWSSYNQQMDN